MSLCVWLRMPELWIPRRAADTDNAVVRAAGIHRAALCAASVRRPAVSGTDVSAGRRIWVLSAASDLYTSEHGIRRMPARLRPHRHVSAVHRSESSSRDVGGASAIGDDAGSAAPGTDRGTRWRTCAEKAVARSLLLAAAATLGLTTAAAGQARDSLARPDSVAPNDNRARAPVRLCAGGDVTLGTNLDTTWAKAAAKRLRLVYRRSSAPDSLLAPLQPLFTDADVVLVNVEGAIGEGRSTPKCGKRAQHCFAFRQPIAAASALRHLADSAIVVGNVANNHARDAGDDGFAASLGHLARAGVLVTGADTLATPVVTRRGDTLAVLGFYTSTDAPDARDLAAVRRHVERAVAQFGTVIVTMHLGAEGAEAQRTRDSTELFLGTIDRGNPIAFATAALDAGATMVIGHGPHVVRAAEWRGDRVVLYSLGNLLTYGPFRLAEPMNRGVVACADIDSARHVRSAWLRPTVQLAPGILRPDSTARAASLMDSLSALDLPGTAPVIGADGVLRRRAPADSVRLVSPGQRSGGGRISPPANATSAIHGTRATPRQSLIFGAGGRLSGLSITRPATLLAWTNRPSPT